VDRFSDWYSFESSRDSSETESKDSGPILDRARRNSSKEKTVRIVKLAHYSVKEYLTSDRINLGKASIFRASYSSANSQMTRTSLLYMFHYDSSAANSGSEKDLTHFPLLRYACRFWYSHFKSIPKEYQMPIDALVLRFFLSSTALQSCLPVHRPDKDWLGPFVDMAREIYPPLYHASDIGLTSIVKSLLDTGASVSAKADNGKTALHRAAWLGHGDIVRLLLDHNAKIDEEDGYERTALHHASTNGHGAVVRVLLDHGASINTRSDRESACNWTALTWAAEFGHEDVVQLLLESGKAQVNLKDQLGRTALHLVSNSYAVHQSVMRLLLEHKADANARNKKGEMPLHLACERGHPSLVCLLLKHNAEVNARKQRGQTPLHRAAENPDEYYLAMELLLKHKADVNARDKKGRTALYYASK
jgi:ankyrin repeat protein